jgi:hypothetical protein
MNKKKDNKDWLDDHLIIDGVDAETAKLIKDRLRDKLKDDKQKG